MPGRPQRRLRAADALIDRAQQLRRDIETLATPAALATDLDLTRADRLTRHWADAAQASEKLLFALFRLRGEMWVRLRDASRWKGVPVDRRILPGPPPGARPGPDA